MPRRRIIDPGLWLDERFMAVSHAERLLTIGLVCMADDEGRLSGSPKVLRAAIFGGDDDTTSVMVAGWLETVARTNPNVQWYVGPDGQPYVYLRRFHRHQAIRRPTPSTLPAAPLDYDNDGPLPYPYNPDTYDPRPSAWCLADNGDVVLDMGGQDEAPTRRRGRPKGSTPKVTQEDAPPPPDPKPAAVPAAAEASVFVEVAAEPWEEAPAEGIEPMALIDLSFQRVSEGHRPLTPVERMTFRRLIDKAGWDAEYLAYCVARVADSRAQKLTADPIHSPDYFVAALNSMRAEPLPPKPDAPAEPVTPKVYRPITEEEAAAQKAAREAMHKERQERQKPEFEAAKAAISHRLHHAASDQPAPMPA